MHIVCTHSQDIRDQDRSPATSPISSATSHHNARQILTESHMAEDVIVKAQAENAISRQANGHIQKGEIRTQGVSRHNKEKGEGILDWRMVGRHV